MPHRTPIESRIVYHALKLGESPVINLDVDGNIWKVVVTLVWFKTDERNVTYSLGTHILDPPLQNIVARLKHHFPHLTKLTVPKLESLLKQSIVKGIYEERGADSAVVFLTLNDWMQLKPKTDKSRLITTTPSKYRRLAKDEDKIMVVPVAGE